MLWRIWISLGTVDITASVPCRPYGSLLVPAAAIQAPPSPVLRWLSKGLPPGVPLSYIPCGYLRDTPHPQSQTPETDSCSFSPAPPSTQGIRPFPLQLRFHLRFLIRLQKPGPYKGCSSPENSTGCLPLIQSDHSLSLPSAGQAASAPWPSPHPTPSTPPAGQSQPVSLRGGIRELSFLPRDTQPGKAGPKEEPHS